MAFSHISWVLRWSGTYLNKSGSMHTALLHISWVLKRSETYPRVYGFLHTASSHIFCFMKWSGIYLSIYGSSVAAASHIYCIWKRWSVTSSIQYSISPKAPNFIYALGWVRSEYTLRRWFSYQIAIKLIIWYQPPPVTSTASSRLLALTNPSHDQDAMR